tara:strand:- start:6240 stop:6434 length:195 start_codon:yes stop_codon:yes gene_type:complete
MLQPVLGADALGSVPVPPLVQSVVWLVLPLAAGLAWHSIIAKKEEACFCRLPVSILLTGKYIND